MVQKLELSIASCKFVRALIMHATEELLQGLAATSNDSFKPHMGTVLHVSVLQLKVLNSAETIGEGMYLLLARAV